MTHPLRELLDGAARGEFPPNDWRTEVVRPPDRFRGVVIGMTGHVVIAADVGDEFAAMDPVDAMSARTLVRLGDALGARPGTYDALLVAQGTGAGSAEWLEERDAFPHARVERAMRYRRDCRIFVAGDGDAVLVVGRGLCDRWEFGYEIALGARGAGLGRAVAAAARDVIPAGEAMWAQVAPGNAASMRSTAAAGFVPVGAEVLFVA
jgi:hypothetical protein